MTSVPTDPGWYPDPESPERERWWDGAAWTEFTTAWADREDREDRADPPSAAAPAGAESSPAVADSAVVEAQAVAALTSGGRDRWRPTRGLLVLGGVALLVVAGVAVVIGVLITSAGARTCDPNYEGGCVPISTDVDCPGENGDGPAYAPGPVRVTGTDIYALDRDADGLACDG